MPSLLQIAVIAEKTRAYPRELCRGIASVGQDHKEWALHLLSDIPPNPDTLARYDAFIVRAYDQPFADRLLATGKPVVDVYGGAARCQGLHLVDADHRAIGVLAARYFAARCYNHFAFCGYQGIFFSDRREQAFSETLSRTGAASFQAYPTPKKDLDNFNVLNLRREEIDSNYCERHLARWVFHLPKPVAILCSHDARALQLLRACRSAGVGVPNEVAIMGVDNDTLICGFCTPPLSSIDPNAFAIGQSAAGILAKVLAGEDPSGGGEATLIRPKGIVERGTSAYYPTAPEWLPSAVGFIRREFGKGISATDVFRTVGLSHTVVEQAFRRHLRTTVQQEIMRHRLNGAIELLCTTSLTSAEISRRTGFSSPQYFARFFLEQTRCTPGAFRERNSGPAWERHAVPSAVERGLLDPAAQAVE